jgi:hypothetical protein
MKKQFTKEQLLRLLDRIMHPKIYNESEKEGGDTLLSFCGGCPDPVKARWLIVECLDPMSEEELVNRALAMPLRLMIDIPTSELPAGHPLRTMAA